MLRIYVKAESVVFQYNKKQFKLLRNFLSATNRLFSKGKPVGELLASGFGWYTVSTETPELAAELIRYVYKREQRMTEDNGNYGVAGTMQVQASQKPATKITLERLNANTPLNRLVSRFSKENNVHVARHSHH